MYPDQSETICLNDYTEMSLKFTSIRGVDSLSSFFLNHENFIFGLSVSYVSKPRVLWFSAGLYELKLGEEVG